MMELLHEILDLIYYAFFPNGRLDFDWTRIMLLSIFLFFIKGWKNGWQKGLVTLISLFLAWGIAQRTVGSLLALFDSVLGLRFSDDMTGFFGIILYLASAVMVSMTANRVISAKVEKPERLFGAITGILSGYLFIALFLDVGHVWLANHLEVASLHFPIPLPWELSTTFTNNPTEVYSLSSGWQNIILLLLIIVFFQAFLFQAWSTVNKWRPKKK